MTAAPTLTGLVALTRFILRRDRLRLILWVGGLAGVLLASAASLPPVYPDQAAIDRYAELVGSNPVLVAFVGPGYGADNPDIGFVLVNEVQVFGAIGIALMGIFLVTRLTRAEEDSERADLVRSSVVGRHAPTAAALLVVGGASVLVGVLCAVGFIALDYPATGSVALAASFTAVGLVFAGLTAVAAQLMSGSRATIGLASTALGVAFAVRAVGDIAGNWMSWASPIGWAQAVRAFADERWWTLGLCLVAAIALVVAAFWLSTRRDIGSGLLPQRLGRPAAARWMTTPLGLAFRLQRGALAGWTVGLFLTGVVFGSLTGSIEELIAENPAYADLMAQAGADSLVDSYFATSMLMMALITAGFSLSSFLRAHTEENAGRAEPVLAAPVGRWRWLASHLAIAAVGTTIVMAAAGLGTGITAAVETGEPEQVLRLAGAALVTVPAILVLVGLAVALFGLFPRFVLAGAWSGLAVMAVVGFLAELLRLPDWVRAISPLDHVPAVPAESLTILPLAVLGAIAIALVALGAWGFSRRDLQT